MHFKIAKLCVVRVTIEQRETQIVSFGSFRESPHITCLWAGAMVKMVDEVLVLRMLDAVLYLYYCQHRQLSERFHLYDVRALMVSFLSLNPVERQANKRFFLLQLSHNSL